MVITEPGYGCDDLHIGQASRVHELAGANPAIIGLRRDEHDDARSPAGPLCWSSTWHVLTSSPERRVGSDQCQSCLYRYRCALTPTLHPIPLVPRVGTGAWPEGRTQVHHLVAGGSNHASARHDDANRQSTSGDRAMLAAGPFGD